MKKRLVIGMLAVALAAGGIGAGATTGRVMPTMGQLFGVTAAGAASLNVEAVAPLTPTGSGFTYQGRLKNRTTPANGQFGFQFSLYDAPTGGILVAGPIRLYNQEVSEGLFTVLVDLGETAFNGDARYLEIGVSEAAGDGGGYTILSPRQPITPAPYALFALKTKGYKNVVVVSPEGGDFTSVQAALNSITTNTSTNKYLIWIGPGTYTERVTMKQWVDIEGAGELNTKITFTGSASNNTGTVVGASNAELRSLTVENSGGNTWAIAIYNAAASPSLLHITATASGGTNSTGVYNFLSSSNMTNVTATAFGGGSDTRSYGVYNSNSSVLRMDNVTATASGDGGSDNYGVSNNYGSSPNMTNVIATGSGGSSSYGVHNFESSSPSMTNVTVTASGGSLSNFGVSNYNSSPSMNNVTVTASGTSSFGVYSSGSGTHTINNSVITSGLNTIVGSAQVGASKLNGGPVSGAVTCAGVYDENYVFYPSTCP